MVLKTKYKKICNPQPCNACPWRRVSIPGWLGRDTPTEFLLRTMSDVPMPCHKTINYEDKKWYLKWFNGKTGKLCAGSLIFFSNICKLSRDSQRPRLPSNKELVFSSGAEFL